MTARRRFALVLVVVTALGVSAAACGTKDNGGVITPSNDTTTTATPASQVAP